MLGIIFWIAFVIYGITTYLRVRKENKLIVSAVAILVMFAIMGWHIFNVPIAVELK